MASRPRAASPGSSELPETRVGAPKPSRRFHAALEVDICPPGTIVGEKYEVTTRIGRGGMGFVVAAKHIELGHSVAIKVMHQDDVGDAISVRRFLREGRAAAALKSDYAVRIYDVGRLDTGVPYLVMEHLEGNDLSAYVKKKRQLPVDEAVEYIVQASFALSEAHASGLIHRDLKPHNMFLARLPDGKRRIKVLDFGLVKEVSGSEPATSTMETPSAPEGTILGSPHFMSPEQIRDAGAVDVRTDIWSLGATFFQLLTGEPPFHALTIHLLLAKILTDRAPDVRTLRSDVPEGVAKVIARCLAHDPKDRYASVDDLVRALNACGATKATPSTRLETPNTAELKPVGTGYTPTRAAPLAAPLPAGAVPAAVPPKPAGSDKTIALIPDSDATKQGLGSYNAPVSPHTIAIPRSNSPSASIAAVEPPSAPINEPSGSMRSTRIALFAAMLFIACAVGGFFAYKKSATKSATATTTHAPPEVTTSTASSPPSAAPAVDSPAVTASAVAPAIASSSAPVALPSTSPATPAAGVKTRPRVGAGNAGRPAGAPKSSSPDPYGWQP